MLFLHQLNGLLDFGRSAARRNSPGQPSNFDSVKRAIDIAVKLSEELVPSKPSVQH